MPPERRKVAFSWTVTAPLAPAASTTVDFFATVSSRCAKRLKPHGQFPITCMPFEGGNWGNCAFRVPASGRPALATGKRQCPRWHSGRETEPGHGIFTTYAHRKLAGPLQCGVYARCWGRDVCARAARGRCCKRRYAARRRGASFNRVRTLPVERLRTPHQKARPAPSPEVDRAPEAHSHAALRARARRTRPRARAPP